MNQILKIISVVLLPLLMMFVACDEENPTVEEETQTQDETSVIPDSIKNKINQQDTLLATVSSTVDTLVAAKNELNRQLDDLKEQFEKSKEPSSMWNILAIIAVVLSVISLIRSLSNNNKEVDRIECEITKLKAIISDLQSQSPRISQGQIANNGINDLRNRVSKLEGQLQIQKQQKTTPTQATPKVVAPKHSTTKKIFYVNEVSGKWLVMCTDLRLETSILKVTSTSKDCGSFDITDLKMIQQHNELNDIVEIADASCRIADAKAYSVVSPGECEFIPKDDYWKVTKNLKIKIF